MPISSKCYISGLFSAILLLTACDHTPPDHRAPVTLPVYTKGDVRKGATIYKEACGQCHQLNAGLNKKGPQLMNIYGAPAAQLKDYTYSEGLAQSGWVWNAETLDPYIADAQKAMPNSKMLSDPMPDIKERTDLIAYLSTLRAAAPVVENNKNNS
ncbi:c-type cytochrome [Psychrobacter alimentarius]|uniref:c-type cytochrome n=1 Tax=Psychrobacter TaxID=497 RepID=UPI000BAABDD0|nr:c-type cytochrome [Psychrobacter sp. JB193]PAT62963.1 cytochrome C [Psychrobacter sp. JB193]